MHFWNGLKLIETESLNRRRKPRLNFDWERNRKALSGESKIIAGSAVSFGVPIELLHLAVAAENEHAGSWKRRVKIKRDERLPNDLAHVQDINPILALVGDRVFLRFAVTRERLRFRHADERRLLRFWV